MGTTPNGGGFRCRIVVSAAALFPGGGLVEETAMDFGRGDDEEEVAEPRWWMIDGEMIPAP